jgi:hypothetical protein
MQQISFYPSICPYSWYQIGVPTLGKAYTAILVHKVGQKKPHLFPLIGRRPFEICNSSLCFQLHPNRLISQLLACPKKISNCLLARVDPALVQMDLQLKMNSGRRPFKICNKCLFLCSEMTLLVSIVTTSQDYDIGQVQLPLLCFSLPELTLPGRSPRGSDVQHIWLGPSVRFLRVLCLCQIAISATLEPFLTSEVDCRF